MEGKARDIPLDPEILMGIQQGYLRSAERQWQRHADEGRTDLLAEEGAYNQFLWKKCLFPGLARYVAAHLDQRRYNDRIRHLVAAVVTRVLEDKPTLHSMANAFRASRWNDRDRKKLQRMVNEYLPDVVQRVEADHCGDRRRQPYSTSFDPLPGAQLPPAGAVPEIDLDSWKLAPVQRFQGGEDQLMVSASLLAAHPEYLRVWILVQATINNALRQWPERKHTTQYQTIRHPLAVQMLANHAIAICADNWWAKRPPQVQAKLLSTPRIFAYDEEAASGAARQWEELSALHEEWGHIGFISLNQAAVGLQRWGAAASGGVLLQQVAGLQGISEGQSGNLLANAGILFRQANDGSRSEACLRRAIPFLRRTEPRLQLVVRVNLAEALGGVSTLEARTMLREARNIAGDHAGLQETFWRNVATACQRLGYFEHEETAWSEWACTCIEKDPTMAAQVVARCLDLVNLNCSTRPVESESFFGTDASNEAIVDTYGRQFASAGAPDKADQG